MQIVGCLSPGRTVMGRAACVALAVALSACCAAQQMPDAPVGQAPSAPDFTSARKLMEQGKFDEAIAQLHSIEAANPAARGLALEMGTAYYKKSDFPNAIESLKKANTADPSDQDAIQLLGLSYYMGGRPTDAIPWLEKVQGWLPRANVDASYVLGICYIQTKNNDKARQAFGKMFDVAPDSAPAYLFTARMLLRQEFDGAAEDYAQKAAALDPKLPLAHYLLGEIYVFRSRIPEAIAEFRKELTINPAHAPAYYKLADAYARVDNYEEAERLVQRSIWLDPSSTGPYILLGKVLEKKGEYELAMRALRRAVSMDPNNPTTHHMLGQVYRDMGKREDAESELRLAEQLKGQQNLQP